MADEETVAEAETRYLKAVHAMQSGVAMELNYDDSHSPKHLRVGVNSALVDSSALATLLIARGVFTELEYKRAIADAMEAEIARYEARISRRLGSAVKLM